MGKKYNDMWEAQYKTCSLTAMHVSSKETLNSLTSSCNSDIYGAKLISGIHKESSQILNILDQNAKEN